MTKRRCYFVHEGDEMEGGVGVIAHSNYEARKIVGKDNNVRTDELYAMIVKKANITGLKSGHILEDMDGLMRGVYGSVEDGECPVCKKIVYVSSHDVEGKRYISCLDCYDKEEDKAAIQAATKKEKGE